ncbi:MAG: SusE domain-containing protein [Ferruginibacter sp.]
MKKILKQLFFLSLLAALFASCKKDENKVFYKGGTAPALTSSVTSAILPLSYADRDKDALKLSWTNPNYQFTTGVSSQDVSYQVEIDTTGADFTNPKRQTISVSKELSKSILVAEFNGFLLNQLQLDTSASHNIEIRVKSSLTNSSAILYSNILKYTVTPYAIPPVVAPPSTGTLFIVGSAMAESGWNNPISPASRIPVQQFTKISPTLFQITVPIVGGGEYKLISVNGSWNEQWSTKTNADPTLVNGGDFIFNGQNILAPAASGNYKIEVDFQRGKFTVTKI